MSVIIKGGKIYQKGDFIPNESFLIIEDGKQKLDERVINLDGSFILPSFCDVHVHFREPGFSYKETIKTGSMAAAKSGYGTVLTMPNLNPVPSDLKTLKAELDIIERDSIVNIIPFASITKSQEGKKLSEFETLAPYAIGFSDDGVGVRDLGIMKEAMERAKALDKVIAAHAEDMELAKAGKIRESEFRQIERDIKLADQTGAKYHVCHVSCKESIELIKDAKKSGVDITCETAPHYLLLDDEILMKKINRAPVNGGRFKMNPPIKTKNDRYALIEGIIDGTIDMIATDHAPHSEEEKNRGFSHSLNGITGLETAFPMLYTNLVKTKIIGFDKLISLMSINPRERFKIKEESKIIVDLDEEYKINSREFLSKGKSTPFDGERVYGTILYNLYGGEVIYEK